ncbi:MAG: hypothetical protein IT208_00995 [Chthonomonadales bacterium]|nr:hypothetical protein [Chthonomonadales bacterium]
MARSGMAALIARLRGLVGDPAGSGAAWTDDELEQALDARRREARYLELEPMPERAAGGAVTYRLYRAPCGDWEADEELVGARYEPLTPAESDPLAGRWAMAQEVRPPVRLSGKTYDLCGSAADVLEAWAARVKLEFDFAAGDLRFEPSRKAAALLELAARLRGRQRSVTAELRRE